MGIKVGVDLGTTFSAVSRIDEQAKKPVIIRNISGKSLADNTIDVSAVQQETGIQLLIRTEPVPEDMSWTDKSPKEQARRGSVPEVEVFLAIDLSGSMIGEPTNKAKEAMLEFVNQMNSDYAKIGLIASDYVKIGLIAFADSVTCVLDPTNNYEMVMNAISTIDCVRVGYGNSAEPFSLSYSMLRKGKIQSILQKAKILSILQKTKVRRQYIVVLTDGRWAWRHIAVDQARKCHKAGIDVIALGFGQADYEFLKEIASIDEFAISADINGLARSFSKIATDISAGRGLIRVMK